MGDDCVSKSCLILYISLNVVYERTYDLGRISPLTRRHRSPAWIHANLGV